MSLLRGTQKLRQLNQSSPLKPQALSLLLRNSGHHFSTETTQPQRLSRSPNDSFLSPPSQGPVYGKLFGINENTLKTDIINLFEGCGLTLNDIKVEYDRVFNPLTMLLQFPSFSDFGAAIKENNRKGRWLKLDKVDHHHWDNIPADNGNYNSDQDFVMIPKCNGSTNHNVACIELKTIKVLLLGLPRNAMFDDVERILCGCNYDSSSFEIFTRSAYPDPIRMAKVRFPSQIEAMNAVIQKNGSFCLNNRILARFIQ